MGASGRATALWVALCAVLGGFAGGLFAGGFAYVSPDQFSFAESVVFLTMSLLGGVASPIGSAIGTGLLILIPEWLRFLKSIPGLYLAIYGLFVILIIRYMPDGIWGFVKAFLDRWRGERGSGDCSIGARGIPARPGAILGDGRIAWPDLHAHGRPAAH